MGTGGTRDDIFEVRRGEFNPRKCPSGRLLRVKVSRNYISMEGFFSSDVA